MLSFITSFYRHDGHILRSKLAAIDHNHHIGRAQKKTKNGRLRYTRKFSKRTKKFNLVIIKEEKNYSYRKYLLAAILARRIEDVSTLTSPPVSRRPSMELPSNIAPFPAPATADVLRSYASRF